MTISASAASCQTTTDIHVFCALEPQEAYEKSTVRQGVPIALFLQRVYGDPTGNTQKPTETQSLHYITACASKDRCIVQT